MGEHEDQPSDKLGEKVRRHMMECKIGPALSQLPGDPDIRTLPELEHLPADQPGQRRPVGEGDAKGHAPEALSTGKGDQDQKQHVELTRNVAQRFNHIYGDVFKIPEPYIPKAGARVMSLNAPESKMSKSMPEGCVFLMDKPEDILRKFKRAITDSDTERCVRFDRENKPGVSNLMSIYSAVTGKSFEAIEAEFDGKGYGAFKPVVGEAVVEMLRPIQEETRRLLSDKAYLEGVYRAGAEKASYVAEKTLRKVYKKVGFLAR